LVADNRRRTRWSLPPYHLHEEISERSSLAFHKKGEEAMTLSRNAWIVIGVVALVAAIIVIAIIASSGGGGGGGGY
jgi:hypothetical protein